MNHEKAVELAKGRVGYYLETDDSYPTIEVFVKNKNRSEAIAEKNSLKKTLRDKGISPKFADFDIDSLGNHYHRILCVFDFNLISEEMFVSIVKEMQILGESEWKNY